MQNRTTEARARFNRAVKAQREALEHWRAHVLSGSARRALVMADAELHQARQLLLQEIEK